jgi:nitroimidazol reductase NimA-like FMN-containing flavoprotein (pyridoxamine 5'-phosphate oxidase superfamily)
MASRLIELSADECDRLLRRELVGRIGIGHEEFPLIFPVHYSVVDRDGGLRLRIHTRAGNVIDHPGEPVAFEIDGFDADTRSGWSVLVRGVLISATVDAPDEPRRSMISDRVEPLEIVPVEITGRRLIEINGRWTFDPRGYLAPMF